MLCVKHGLHTFVDYTLLCNTIGRINTFPGYSVVLDVWSLHELCHQSRFFKQSKYVIKNTVKYCSVNDQWLIQCVIVLLTMLVLTECRPITLWYSLYWDKLFRIHTYKVNVRSWAKVTSQFRSLEQQRLPSHSVVGIYMYVSYSELESQFTGVSAQPNYI